MNISNINAIHGKIINFTEPLDKWWLGKHSSYKYHGSVGIFALPTLPVLAYLPAVYPVPETFNLTLNFSLECNTNLTQFLMFGFEKICLVVNYNFLKLI